MALSKDVTFRNVRVPGAYLAVVRPTVSTDKTRLGFSVVTSTAKGEETFTDESYISPYNINAGNDFVQAYAYLKTLPEFSGATDC